MPRKQFGTPAEERLIKLLSEFEPLSHHDVMALEGLKSTAAVNRLKTAWDKKLIYIASYEKAHNGARIPYYALGALPDVERPAPIKRSELRKAWVQRVKKNDRAKYDAMIRRADERKRERIDTEPGFAESLRSYRAEWARKKTGGAAQVFRSRASLDEIAMQFGITWRFQKTKRKAA